MRSSGHARQRTLGKAAWREHSLERPGGGSPSESDEGHFETDSSVPQVDCPKHVIRQPHVPWAEPSGRFTSLFEAMTISWLKVATIKAVSEQIKVLWDVSTGIPLESWERAVNWGLARRESRPLEDLAVDETSFQKRHEYVTVLRKGTGEDPSDSTPRTWGDWELASSPASSTTGLGPRP